MATSNQEKNYSEALTIARECEADAPRYVALIVALKTVLDWIDTDEGKIWIMQNKQKWASISYEGPLKSKNYQQPFRDENLCILLSDTELLNIEVKHGGVCYRATADCPPVNATIYRSDLPDSEKHASSVTIAYRLGSDKRQLGQEKTALVCNYFKNKYPHLTFIYGI